MSHPIPPDAERLIARAKMLADEMASAARYGLSIPALVQLSGHGSGGASFSCRQDNALFDAWADYTEALTSEYDYAGEHWQVAAASVNGLPLSFHVSHPIEAVAPSPAIVGGAA